MGLIFFYWRNEMYPILIVEDEEVIRNTLPLAIDWASAGFEIVGAFYRQEGRGKQKDI